MAASEAGRPLVYVTWHDQGLTNSFGAIYEYLMSQQATVRDLCMYLQQYSSRFEQMTLFDFIFSTPISSLTKS